MFSQPVFCKDCKWNKLSLLDRLLSLSWASKCSHAKAISKEDGKFYVTGKKNDGFRYASLVREYGPCGTEGKLFEPKN